MPSIEIICLGQAEPILFPDLPFALVAENKLISHRSPSPLFKPVFDNVHGCIYHFGGPELLDPDCKRAFTGYRLLSRTNDYDFWNILHFAPDYAPLISEILQKLIMASPTHTLFFTSDYQFGPNARHYKRAITLETFWQRHDTKRLNMNALYPLIP